MKKIFVFVMAALMLSVSSFALADETTFEYDTTYRVHFGFGKSYDAGKFASLMKNDISTAFQHGFASVQADGIWNHPEKGLVREKNIILLIDAKASADVEQKIATIAHKFLEQFSVNSSVYVSKAPIIQAKVYY